MHQDLRDLTHAGLYLLCLAFLIIGGAYGFTLVLRHSAATFIHAVLPKAGLDAEQTRISEVLKNAREVRASLAKPLPPLEKLPPITATVAYGHLPEREIMTGIGSVAVRQPRVRDREAVGGERIRFGSSFNTAKHNAGMAEKDLHFHDLRGTAATKFYIAGLPVRVIAEMLAWSGEQVERIIRRYVGRTAATKEAIRQLNTISKGRDGLGS